MKIEDIVAIRIANGIKQYEFAELINVPVGTWSNVEHKAQPLYSDVRAKAVQTLKDLGCDFSVLQNKDLYERIINSKKRSVEMVKNNHTVIAKKKEEKDKRYNEPKETPDFTEEEIDQVIGETEIYRRVRAMMNESQRKQISYGMNKYPETLNADTWSMIETIDHIIEESIDRLHYLMMLRIKLEKNPN